MNYGSLCMRNGVLYVARHEQTAHVRPYDLDGRALGPGFSFRGPAGEPCGLGGIEVDSDHQVWLADTLAGHLRAFTLFGRESVALKSREGARDDARGSFEQACDVALHETDDERLVLVASGGWRRHALQLVRPDGTLVESLRPEGSPLKRFRGLTRVAHAGRWTFACEAGASRVQVFRDFDFHFAFQLSPRTGVRLQPVALAPLSDGRCVVAVGGDESALLLVDAAGRLQRVLASHGSGHGEVEHPGDVAVEDLGGEATPRIAVIDRDAERVQVFTLEGRCHGELEALPGNAIGDLE